MSDRKDFTIGEEIHFHLGDGVDDGTVLNYVEDFDVLLVGLKGTDPVVTRIIKGADVIDPKPAPRPGPPPPGVLRQARPADKPVTFADHLDPATAAALFAVAKEA